MTARTLVSVVATLHAHRSTGTGIRQALGELIPGLDRQASFIKLDRWRQNIVHFFDFVDECWGLRKVTMRELSLQVRSAFLQQVASVLSDHCDFWTEPNEMTLKIDADWRRRFATFPLHDPTVVQLVTSGGSPLLYSLLRDHLNKGRSINRLRNRDDEAAAKAPRRFSDVAPEEVDFEYPSGDREE